MCTITNIKICSGPTRLSHSRLNQGPQDWYFRFHIDFIVQISVHGASLLSCLFSRYSMEAIVYVSQHISHFLCISFSWYQRKMQSDITCDSWGIWHADGNVTKSRVSTWELIIEIFKVRSLYPGMCKQKLFFATNVSRLALSPMFHFQWSPEGFSWRGVWSSVQYRS